MDNQFCFPGLTLLITHHNRSNSLERLLSVFSNLNCHFADIVVSDDCSDNQHSDKIKSLQGVYNFRLIGSPVNRGLGNNLNKGQDAVTTPYTLYIQEDFVPLETFPAKLQDALELMNEREDIDIARFYAYDRYPCLTPLKNGFSEMHYRKWQPGNTKFNMYSDHPHLRRSNFTNKFGRYKEGIHSDITEYRMCISFLQKKGKGLFFNEYSSLFLHDNSPEASTIGRADWRQSKNKIFLLMRKIYLQYKWLKRTLDLKLMRT